MSSPTINQIKRSIEAAVNGFPNDSKLDGGNWSLYSMEMEMTFTTNEEVWSHITGECSSRPSPVPADPATKSPGNADDVKTWDALESLAFFALWRTISDMQLRNAHVKKGKLASDAWKGLKALYEKDTRSRRLEFKTRLYNPVHDTSRPIGEYIQGIVAASESLAALGHPPADIDVIDSIIMHLDVSHPEWKLVRKLLTTRTTDPTLSELKSLLAEHEREEKLDEHAGGRGGESSALYAGRKGKDKEEKKPKKKSRHRRSPSRDASDSEDGGRASSSGTDRHSFSWLNPRDPKRDCHWCGLRGHIARYCMHTMPDNIRDKVGAANRAARKAYAATLGVDYASDDGAVAGLALHSSDSESESSSSGYASEITAGMAGTRESRRALVTRIQA